MDGAKMITAKPSYQIYAIWDSGKWTAETNGKWFALIEEIDLLTWQVQELHDGVNKFLGRAKHYLSELEMTGLIVTLTNLGHLENHDTR